MVAGSKRMATCPVKPSRGGKKRHSPTGGRYGGSPVQESAAGASAAASPGSPGSGRRSSPPSGVRVPLPPRARAPARVAVIETIVTTGTPVLDERGAGGSRGPAFPQPHHVDLGGLELSDAEKVRARRYRVRMRRTVQDGTEDRGDQDAAIDRPTERKPLIRLHREPAGTERTRGDRLVEDGMRLRGNSGHAHSWPSSRSSASSSVPWYAPVDMYFQPPSATTTAMSARRPAAAALAAMASAACNAPPVEIPAKMPSVSSSSRVRRSASRELTENLVVSTDSS